MKKFTKILAAFALLIGGGGYALTLKATELTPPAECPAPELFIEKGFPIKLEDAINEENFLLAAHPVAHVYERNEAGYCILQDDEVTVTDIQPHDSDTSLIQPQSNLTYPDETGYYDVTFTSVKGQVKMISLARVGDGVKPILTVGKKDITYETGINKTAEEFLIDVNAKLDNPQGTMHTDFNAVVNTKVPGIYFVLIQGRDLNGNKSNDIETTVFIHDEIVNPILTADKDITYETGTDKTGEEFLSDVHAKLDKEGTITSDFDAVVNTEVPGYYFVSIQGTDNESNLSNIIKTTVRIKDKDEIVNPVLTADTSISYEKDIKKTGEEFLSDVHAKLDKKGTITSDFEVMVNTEKAGVYIVTIKGKDADGNKSNVVETKVTITDDEDGLVSTGTFAAEAALGGLSLVATSLGILFRKRK